MKEIRSEKGVPIVINEASFQDALALKNAMFKEVSKTGLKTDLENMKDLKNANINIDNILNTILSVDSSDEVINCLFACMRKCKYDGETITRDTFESVEARESYYIICVEVVKANIFPFFKGLASRFGLNTFLGETKENQK